MTDHQHDEFEGVLRPNLSPSAADEVKAVWHRYATAALQGLTRTQAAKLDPADIAYDAALYADLMVFEWDSRFNERTVLSDRFHDVMGAEGNDEQGGGRHDDDDPDDRRRRRSRRDGRRDR